MWKSGLGFGGESVWEWGFATVVIMCGCVIGGGVGGREGGEVVECGL